MTVHLQTLGQCLLFGPSGPVSLRPQEVTLLALLAERFPHGASRATIAELLWPMAAPERQLRSLSQLLYQVRRRLPDVSIIPSPKRVSIAQLQTDVTQLLTEQDPFVALTLFRGGFLGPDASPSTEIELWRTHVAKEVAARVGAALDDAIALAQSPEDLEAILACCERLAETGTADVQSYCVHVVANLKLGKARAAELVYEKMTSEFADVAMLPSYDRLRSLAPDENNNRDSQDERVVRFVGRDEELRTLVTLWHKVMRGQGQTVSIIGEPGIGKTRLAEQILRRAALAGAQVWIARCHAGTRRVHFSATAELLRTVYTSEYDIPEQYATVVASLTRPWETSNLGIESPAEQRHFLMLETLSRLMADAATDRPLVILFDDVQWADDFTAQLVTLWALKIVSLRVMLLVTARTEEAEPLPDWLTYDIAVGQTLRLGQLSLESAREIATAFEAKMNISLPAERRNRILWRTGGRPFLLLETLSAAARDTGGVSTDGWDLPETVEALLRRRFRALPESAVWLAGTCAAFGSAVDLAAVLDVSQLREETAIVALDLLSQRGILVTKCGKLDFPHDLMRETAYRQMSPAARSLAHQRIAQTLEAQSADPGVLAQHYARSGSGERAGPLALRAAEKAWSNCLYSDSEFYYKFTIAVGSRNDRHEAVLGLVRVLVQTGRTSELEPSTLEMLHEQSESREASLLIYLVELENALASDAVEVGDVMQIARELIGMAHEAETSDLAVVFGMLLDIAHGLGNVEFGREILDAFRAAKPTCGGNEFRKQIEVLTAIWEGTTNGYEHALTRIAGAVDDESEVTPVTLMSACFAKGTISLFSGRLLEAREGFEKARELAQKTGERRRLFATYMNSAVVHMELGDFQAAETFLNIVLSSPNRAHRMRAQTNIAILRFEEGDYVGALVAASPVLSNATTYGATSCRAIAPAIVGLVHLRNGDIDKAREQLTRLEAQYGDDEYGHGDASYTLSFVAHMLAAEGSWEAAIERLDRNIARNIDRDRMCALRLACARAEILGKYDSDRAYAAAKAVVADAHAMQAAPIAARGETVLAATRV
jgi:tetratricopeptide (TPR) repeat protein/DNA-binding SARP family transcriptional activator